MGTQGTGRKRSTKKDKSTAEDDALNLIAREAEARLAAKRAARAEAREIRMKELERQQKELSDDDERMSVGSRGSVRVEDRDYLEKGSRAASALTAGTLTSLGGSSSRRGSGETAITVDAESSLREIKDALAEVEEKYRKAMVSNAQLDNEKNNLMYQVDTLKDSLMELEELLSESHRGYEEKVKELEREKHAHSVLQFQFNEMKEMLKQSEELLNKHGIVLGPDLNINGDIGEAEVDGSPSADPASQPAPDSQPSPTEGNSMLGNTEETQLRSSGDEEVDPEQHQEMFEEAKENHLSSETLCNVASVSTLERLSKDEPTEEQTCSATEEDTVEETHLGKDLNVEIDACSTTEAKDAVDGLGLQGIVPSSEENKPETETPEVGGLGETSNPDLGEAETKGSSVDAQSDDIRESCNNAFEEQENKQEDVEESNLRITETCPQQNVTRDVIKETEENEPQQEPENPEEAENDEAEEMSSKSQPQGATASGKKKKKRKRGKKKGGGHENKTQQKDDTDKEKGKTEKVESAPTDHGPSTEPDIDVPVTQPLEESRVDLVKNEQGRQKTEEIVGEQAVKPSENFPHSETLQESGVDHVTDEHDKKQTLETGNVEEVEAVTTTETFSHIDTPIEIRVDHVTDEVNEEQSLEVETVEAVAPIETCSPVEALSESSTDPKNDEQHEEQSLEAEPVEAVAPTEAFSLVETPQESETSPKKDEQDEEQSLVAVEAVAPIETCSHAEALNESSTDPKEDEQDEEQTIETEEAEEVRSVTSAVPEGSLSTLDLIIDSKGAENTDDLDEVCTPIVDNSKNEMDISTNGTVIHTESELIDSAADEVGSVNKKKSKSTTSDPENTFDTNGIENTEVESQVPSNVDVAADESESQNNSESKDGESPSLSSADDCLSGSEPPSEPSAAVNLGSDDTPAEVSDKDPKEATETIKDDEEPAAQTEQESFSPSHDGDNSELKPDGTDQEELKEDVNEPEALVESDSPSHEEEGASCDSTSLTNSDAVHTESSLPETAVQAGQLDNEVSSETKDISTMETFNTLDSPKEATEIVSSIEQDHGAEESTPAEDPELKNHQNDVQTEAQLELHEPSKGKSEDNDSSRPALQDSDIEDDEEGEDDEGQSFDFDDMDMELAVETKIPKDPKQEEVEEGVEVMSDESNSGSSGLCQSNTESNENTQDRPVENNDEKCAVDGGNQVDTLDEEATSGHVSEVQNNTPEEEVVVADEPVVGEEKALIVGEPGDIAGSNTQATPLPVEEGVDAIEHELQGENAALPKSADQVASNKEPPQAKKDPKKNSKKGKPKGKEDCKMS